MKPTDEQLLRAYDQAPAVIQESLAGGGATAFMAALPSRYDLHLDTAGYVMDFVRDMLLGFLRPEQFMTKLQTIGITGEAARQIVTDLNKEVFIPLRDEMRKGGAATRPSTVPHVPLMNVEAKPPAVPESEAPAAKPASVQPSYNLVPSEPANPLAPPPVTPAVSESAMGASVPTLRTMQHDMDLVEHGQAAAPYSAPNAFAAAALHPSQMTPAQAFQTASVPVTATVPVPMPAASRPIPVPAMPKPQPVPTPAPQNPAASLPPISSAAQVQAPNPAGIAPSKEYTSDPYREPI